LRPAILSVLVLSLVTGGLFPLILFAIGVFLFPYQAGGSLTLLRGAVIGSRLIGQDFTGPEWFQPRPSAAGNGYDGTASGASMRRMLPTRDVRRYPVVQPRLS
jgi:potassium-transporting ATPase KdpC subunit